MGIVCPHYTHTDRTVGSNTSHVCRDCMAPIAGCEHLAPAPEPAALVAQVVAARGRRKKA